MNNQRYYRVLVTYTDGTTEVFTTGGVDRADALTFAKLHWALCISWELLERIGA